MAKDYKDTLNLPQTDFPMKANLAQKEPVMLQFWEENGIYAKLQEKTRGGKHYILHDGPPYANGHIHIGHALNKILKDIIVKYKAMNGFYSPYIPGWDCHGLPIELQVDKNLGDKKDKLGVPEKRALCREYALKFVDIQRDEFKRLGVFGDWQTPYLTLSNDYEATIVGEFCKFVESGDVYKGKKPVHWCPACVTALAEAEVEYNEKESPSVFVKFALDQDSISRIFPELAGRPVSVIIWTTTPWTLPANLALAFHPDFEYAAVEQGDEIYIVAEGCIEGLKEKIGLHGTIVLKKPGRDLEGLEAFHPFLQRKSRAVLGEFVSLEEGTGIVHIAPGHGEDDYEIGLKYNLDIYAPVDKKGLFTFAGTDRESSLQGKFVFRANTEIIEILRENNALVLEEKVVHSYPHCWRCKKPVIFRATAQWFISMGQNNLREKALSEISRVTWIPKWGKERIYGMVANRPDWCISRQRAWGVPITLFRCEACDGFVTDHEVLSKIIRLIAEHSTDIWFTGKPEEILPAGYQCKKCGGMSFAKEMDILDVWFDSGVSHAAVVELDPRLSWPSDLYLEGSDQHRGWFQSSLLASTGTRGSAPYRTVLTHGFVVDGQGKKMSKSLGNVVAPQEVIKTNGAEILRLWVSAEDYRDDIRISKEILERLTEAYRKIRNTCRFLLGNIFDFDGGNYQEHLLEIDRWALSRLQSFTRDIITAYENFDFHEVFHTLHNFCVLDMSSLYLDVLKDRLYTFQADHRERRAAQWVLLHILSTMTRLMAPVLSFTGEEVWQSLRKKMGFLEESVFLAPFPGVSEKFVNDGLERKWTDLFRLRNEVNKALELKRAEKLLGNALEARVKMKLPQSLHSLIAGTSGFLPTFFIVSAVELTDQSLDNAYRSSEIEGLEIGIERAPGSKCQRCWNWAESVGSFPDDPDVCERCYNVIHS
ncbi:MAG: isoleucine--tRNA ligase [Nitrospirota bacterium]